MFELSMGRVNGAGTLLDESCAWRLGFGMELAILVGIMI